MHTHQSNRERVASAIAGIKAMDSHESRLEAYLLLNAEINARVLDSIDDMLDTIESVVENDVVKTKSVP